jgi:hypothetical protein
MRQPEPRGEPCAEIDQRYQSSPPTGSSPLAGREPLSSRSLDLNRRCGKPRRQTPGSTYVTVLLLRHMGCTLLLRHMGMSD